MRRLCKVCEASLRLQLCGVRCCNRGQLSLSSFNKTNLVILLRVRQTPEKKPSPEIIENSEETISWAIRKFRVIFLWEQTRRKIDFPH